MQSVKLHSLRYGHGHVSVCAVALLLCLLVCEHVGCSSALTCNKKRLLRFLPGDKPQVLFISLEDYIHDVGFIKFVKCNKRKSAI